MSIGIDCLGQCNNTGGYLVENRAAAQNSDRLVAQNIDLSGAIITVTNIGSGLASGDTRLCGPTVHDRCSRFVTGGLPRDGSRRDVSNLTVNGRSVMLPLSPVLTNAISGGGTTLDFRGTPHTWLLAW